MRPSLALEKAQRRIWPATRVVPKTVPVPGYNHFVTPLRKVVVDYDPLDQHQQGLRQWLKTSFLKFAKANPDVEFLVRPVRRAGLATGLYVTGRDKAIPLSRFDLNQVDKKVIPRFLPLAVDEKTPDDQLHTLLNSSGQKIRHLKNAQIEAGPGGEAARGIYSILHDHAKPGGGYII